MAEDTGERLRQAVGAARERTQAARERARETRERAAKAKERAEQTAARARDTAVEVGERVDRGVERVDRGIERVDEGIARVDARVERAQEVSQQVDPAAVGSVASAGAKQTLGIEQSGPVGGDPFGFGGGAMGGQPMGGQPFGGNSFGMGQAPPAEPVEPRRDDRPPREEVLVERQPADPFGFQMGGQPREEGRQAPAERLFGGGLF